MRERKLIVLKFGGSVLREEGRVERAVHEVYRWRRDGFAVVAVVSALEGHTDERLELARRLDPRAGGHAVASLLAGGELHASALLGTLLERAGVRARVLWPGALGLLAEGPALDAMPRATDTALLERALAADEVVVVPGFVGLDAEGRTVTFGRGGSDLTALHLADRLGAARCRLIKDVDALYVSDPATAVEAPDRYLRASPATALEAARAPGASILQPKAVSFAWERRLPFEVGAFNGVGGTLIGDGPTVSSPPEDSPPPLRVAVLGLGTVGLAVVRALRSLPELFELTGILVRHGDKPRPADVPPGLPTSDPDVALRGAQLVVEAIGGCDRAGVLIRRALRGGADVVTANKALMAERGAGLAAEARRRGRRLLCSASVGGSTPVLERLSQRRQEVTRVRGILNGTVNFVLEELAGGAGLDEALVAARERGLAEQDPSRDLSGLDAAEKLAVIAHALGRRLPVEGIARDALDESVAEQARAARARGARLAQVSELRWTGRGPVASVRLLELGADDPLAAVRGEHNACLIERRTGPPELLRGTGAGGAPTGTSVLGDLLRLHRERAALEVQASGNGSGTAGAGRARRTRPASGRPRPAASPAAAPVHCAEPPRREPARR